jgi:hypothetical protein
MKIMRASDLERIKRTRSATPEEIERLVDTVWRWKRALEGLTPSGSEFVDDPEFCAKYVKDQRARMFQYLRGVQKLERRAVEV